MQIYRNILILIFSTILSTVYPVSVTFRRGPGELNRHEKDISPVIAGGNAARKGQFPWLVSIQATNFEEGWHLCGGTLITPTWVLTAAHCLDSEKPEWIWIVTGEYDMSVEEGTEQKLRVDQFVKHPDYVYYKKPYENDIALVHLSTPARLDRYTATMKLPTSYNVDSSVRCYDAGWGASSEGSPGSDILQYIEVPIVRKEICGHSYGTALDDQSVICAGSPIGGNGFCVGDNGGPLNCMVTDGNFEITGIASWRKGCAERNNPGVYVNTTFYNEWIFKVISSEFNVPRRRQLPIRENDFSFSN